LLLGWQEARGKSFVIARPEHQKRFGDSGVGSYTNATYLPAEVRDEPAFINGRFISSRER
ncbi:MAG: hypothetical protein ACQEW0_10965, partial [Pseudomonadota bacterium]